MLHQVDQSKLTREVTRYILKIKERSTQTITFRLEFSFHPSLSGHVYSAGKQHSVATRRRLSHVSSGGASSAIMATTTKSKFQVS